MSVSLQYTDSMEAVLDWFGEQECSCATVGLLTDEITYSRETIRRNLKELAADGCAELRHGPTALYRIRYDPRERD